MSWRIASADGTVVTALGYECRPVPTRWLDADDSLAEALVEHLPELHRNDTVVVSEKVAVLLTGRAVPASEYPPGRFARVLIRFIRPPEGSRGLSVPAKMEFVVRAVGVPRLLFAAIASAVTRPLGVKGVFYRVAGSVARDIDGGRPPYEAVLLPPLTPRDARALCTALENSIGVGVAVVDVNDYGGSVRATSPTALSGATLARVLRGNPLGQRMTGTPFGIVRPTAATPPA